MKFKQFHPVNIIFSFKSIAVIVLLFSLSSIKETKATTYYSGGNFAPNLTSSWWTNINGTGSHPSNFTTSGYVFIIQSGHSMMTTASWTVSGTGSTIQINSGGTLVASNAVTATLMIINGLYQHNQDGGAIPVATWDINSTCIITGVTLNAPSGLNQVFGNFTWNCMQTNNLSLAGALTTVNGNLLISSTGNGGVTITGNSLKLDGNLNVGGNFTINGTTTSVNLNGTTNNYIYNIGGNVTLGGNWFFTNGTASTIVNLNGYGKTFSVSTYNFLDFNTYVNTSNVSFQVTNNASYSLGSNISIPGSNSLTVNNGGTLNTGTFIINNNVQGGTANGGTFAVATGGTLEIGSSAGITSSGLTGNIQNATRNFSTGGNYTYNGITNQFTGNGLPATVNNLTIINTGVSGNNTVILLANSTVNGNLTITSGILDVSASNYNIYLAGNLTNSGTFNSRTGSFNFNGSSSQIISGTSTTTFYNFIITNGNKTITLNSNIIIGDILTFPASPAVNTFIDLTTKNLTMNTWAAGHILNWSGNNFVIINNSGGTFTINGVASGVTANFPMGLTNASKDYCGVNIKNNSSSNSFTINSVCQYINTTGTCSEGTPVTVQAVNLTYDILSTCTNADVTLYWDASKELSFFNRTICQINHYENSNWVLKGVIGAASNLSGTIYSITGNTTGFSPFGVSSGGSTLPIELINFSADIKNREVEINWSTATETNNDYFTLEKSKDGFHFEKIQVVPGAGNSNIPLNYLLVDDNPYFGVSYYRLSQTDYNGKGKTFPMVAINYQPAYIDQLVVFPNPVKNFIQIGFENNEDISTVVNVQLFDSKGLLILQKDFISNKGFNEYTMTMNNSLNGLYFLSIIMNNQKITQKICFFETY